MKKLFSFLLISILAFNFSEAQVTFNPAVFTAEDQVTLTVDVTGTGMAGKSEAYIWIFSNPTANTGPQVDGSVNGSWGNSSTAAKMTAAGTNKWSFTFTGTTLFNLSPGQLKEFGFLVKAKDGTAQSPDYKPFKFDPLVFTPSTFRIFPSKVGQNDVVTINFDQTLTNDLLETRIAPATVSVSIYNMSNVQVGTTVTIPVRNIGNKLWGATFLPSFNFNIPAGTKLSKFTYKFNGTVDGPTGIPTPASTQTIEVPFLDLK